MRHHLKAIAVSSALAATVLWQAAPTFAANPSSAKISPNKANALPTYPGLTAGDNFPMNLSGGPGGKNRPCTWYDSFTRDNSADVVAWYRHALRGATEKTIVFDQVQGKNVPALDFAEGVNHVTIIDWNSDISKTRIQIWSSPAGANCKVPGM
jgi:hypothetical protein